ncbi:MAG: DUF2089 domain-containing protein [Anaerolineae bacterium]
MYPVLGKCPICAGELTVTHLHCPSCGLTLEGQFRLARFYQLTPEQMHFLETFIRCEGRLNKMGTELNLSYPTVRGRLRDLIRALGYENKEESSSSPAHE